MVSTVKPVSLPLCITLLLMAVTGVPAQTLSVPETLRRLETQQDTDNDRKITIRDRTTAFELRSTDGQVLRTLTNVYRLSVALQELKRAEMRGQPELPLDALRLDEGIVDRTHRLIREVYWDALTRRIDADHIDQVVVDSKVVTSGDYLYVPASDPAAVRYFQTLEKEAQQNGRTPPLKVVVLPPAAGITPEFVRNLDGYHGLLSLKLETNAQGRIRGVPYVVPGGRFNEVYCWDSYFIVLGLLQDGRHDLARGMADNFLYMVEHYGMIPNANRTYYLTRSQPPFLTSIVRSVYEAGAADRNWMARALKIAMAEYRNVWLAPSRLVRIGSHELSRYYDSGEGPCPEVEPGHYDEKIAPWLAQARSAGDPALTPYRFLNEYLYAGKHADLRVDGLTLRDFFKHDRAVRESGHDTTHRFDDRTADFATIDLNSLLYKYEADFAELIEREFNGRLEIVNGEEATTTYWRKRAEARKTAITALMWDEERGYFFDYDFAGKTRSTYISATGLYPLWAKVLDPGNETDRARARRVAAYAREKLEERAGLAATARESVSAAKRTDQRQWDYPFGWAPHQMLAWQGLKQFGLDADAERLAYRWLYAIAKNARDFNGTIPEKLDVVTGSHDVFVEYGNVGTKFDYIAPEGFGWMNASFQVGTNYLSPARLNDLRALKPPPED